MRVLLMLSLLITLALSGCVAGSGGVYAVMGEGILFKHTREPLMLNANSTRVSSGNSSSGRVQEIQVQPVRVTWDSNAIGDIAKAAGIKTVYYADLEVWRVLDFVFIAGWSMQVVHIYGETDGEKIHIEVPVSKRTSVSPPESLPN